MALRSGFLFAKNSILPTTIRAISTTNALNIKEIREEKNGDSLIIQAVTLPSPRADLLVRADKIKDLTLPEVDEKDLPLNYNPEKRPCYLCALGLDVKHTDVLIISQFLRSDGCMLPRRITGLCRRQQKKVTKLVAMAQKAGLMSNLTPANSKKNPAKRRDYKKFNTYFDENTIFMKKIPKPWEWLKR